MFSLSGCSTVDNFYYVFSCATTFLHLRDLPHDDDSRVDPLHWHSAEDSWLGLPLISMVLLTEINTNLWIHLPELAGP